MTYGIANNSFLKRGPGFQRRHGVEKQHQTGNLNFYLAYTGPLGGAVANKDIKVDISQDELIYNAPEEKKIINTYSDLEEEYSLFCYSLGEVIAEKMRCIMQRTAP